MHINRCMRASSVCVLLFQMKGMYNITFCNYIISFTGIFCNLSLKMYCFCFMHTLFVPSFYISFHSIHTYEIV